MNKFLLCSLMGGAFILLTGCGNAVSTDVTGRVGFSRNETGGVVIDVESCGAELDGIDLSGPNIDGENYKYASFKAQTPVSGYFKVDISHPGANWKEETQVEAPDNADELLIGNAFSLQDDVEAYPVAAKLSEIRALKPGEIITGYSEDGASTKIVTQEEFSRCD